MLLHKFSRLLSPFILVFLAYNVVENFFEYVEPNVMRSKRFAEKYVQKFEIKNKAGKNKKFPDFIITGVQKCGTTGLLHFLKGNPYLIAVPGEAHYFDSFINYPKGPAWYMALMPSVHEYHRVYEKTPSYMTLKKVPAKIFNFDSKMKLIAVLCDPVKRSLSHYLHVAGNDIKTKTKGKFQQITAEKNLDETMLDIMNSIFSDSQMDYLKTEYYFPEFDEEIKSSLYRFMDANEDRKPYNFLTRGVYSYHVAHWKKYFPDNQLLFINGKDLAKNPGQSIKEVQQFLGVPQVLNETHFWLNETSGFYCLNASGQPLGNKDCVGAHSGTKGRSKKEQFTAETQFMLEKVYRSVHPKLQEVLNRTLRFK